jgi:hypothetical protein
LGIRDILVRIRILGSVPLTNEPELFSFKTFKEATKVFFAFYFLKLHLHNFSNIESYKKVKKTVVNKVFLLDDGRFQIPTFYYRIREAQKHTDPESGSTTLVLRDDLLIVAVCVA